MQCLIKLLSLVALTPLTVLVPQASIAWAESRTLPPQTESSLILAQESSSADRQAEADHLFQEGVEQFRGNQFQNAFQSWEQALEIYRNIGDRRGEANTLDNLGSVYQFLGNYSNALDYYQQSLTIARDIGDRAGEAATLSSIGVVNRLLRNYRDALDYYQQSLAIARDVGDCIREGITLNNLGSVYQSLGNYRDALDYYQQSLAIARDVGDRVGEGIILSNIGVVYGLLGNYRNALDYYQRSLGVRRDIGDRAGEAQTLNNIGNIYQVLGNYRDALGSYQQSLIIVRNIGDRRSEAQTLGSIGIVSELLGDYRNALDYYQQSLSITRNIGDLQGEANSLNNLASVYESLGRYSEALHNSQRALLEINQTIRHDIDEVSESVNVEIIARSIEDSPQIAYQEVVTLFTEEIGPAESTALLLNSLGILHEEQGENELAIIFLKASVNTREDIRERLRNFPQGIQRSYIEKVSESYRLLANLLLEQDRIPEAQQVLDLLKVEELREFTNTTRATWTGSELEYTDPEQTVIDAHGSLIALGVKWFAAKRRTVLNSIPSMLNSKISKLNMTHRLPNLLRLFVPIEPVTTSSRTPTISAAMPKSFSAPTLQRGKTQFWFIPSC